MLPRIPDHPKKLKKKRRSVVTKRCYLPGREKTNKLLWLVLILSINELVDSFVRPLPSTCFSYQRSTSLPSKPNKKNEGEVDDPLIEILPSASTEDKKQHLEEDIVKKLAGNKDRAVTAKDLAMSELSKSKRIQKSKSAARGKKKRAKDKKVSPSTRKRSNNSGDSFSSLLPPPMKDKASDFSNDDDGVSSVGLSSWDDFLGFGKVSAEKKRSESPPLYKRMHDSRSLSSNLKKGRRYQKKKNSNGLPGVSDAKEQLPSIADLFPPDLYNTSRQKKPPNKKQRKFKDPAKKNSMSPPPPALDGVLPVSDLFYRSSQSMNEDDGTSGDDDELPFSAEQSDKLTSEHNRIKVRRNEAKAATSSQSKPAPRRKFSTPRKMVRRGMEMLVGGVPINADPPQRYIDLLFNHEAANWNEAVLINSRDFGPMYHPNSVGKMSKTEQGLFCEHFVHSSLKWDVCPKDLRTIVKEYTSSLMGDSESESPSEESSWDKEGTDDMSLQERDDLADDDDEEEDGTNPDDENEQAKSDGKDISGLGFGTLKSFNNNVGANSKEGDSDNNSHLGGELVFSIGVSREELETADASSETPVLERVLARGIAAATECTGFKVEFEKLILTDMDDGTTMISGHFTLTLRENDTMNHAEMEKKAQRINSSLAQAMDDGDMQLAMAAAAKEETGWPENVRDRVVEEFLFEEDDGDCPLDEEDEEGEMGRKEKNSSKQENEDRESKPSWKRREEKPVNALDITSDVLDEYDGPFGMPGSKTYHKDDLFLGGGNDGVFSDYSEHNLSQSPYEGNLGLRLVDATVQRAKERYPRVIAIGDVHGCIDELQDLLRQCDYRPGDLVVFLGDLVSKGPDSISVVQMAREIGAIGVRGNHDFEVVRWHQAIKSGVDPPVVGSEHFHIASCLSKADMKWMYSLPWYISSKELGALFVHAGFVSGIRLAKQNPRLMMNMRSILPDGTVTSKFFNNWPWARLWDGPQTVLFGHDADRGLQQYEHAVGLDTGCVYGGRLTACILPEKRLVSVSARREYFKYRRKHYD